LVSALKGRPTVEKSLRDCRSVAGIIFPTANSLRGSVFQETLIMAIAVSCPTCAAPYRLRDDVQGKMIRCRQCQNVFTANVTIVPAAEPAARDTQPLGVDLPPAITSEALPYVDRDIPTAEAITDTPMLKRPRGRPKPRPLPQSQSGLSTSALAALTCVTLLAGLACVGVSVYISATNAPPDPTPLAAREPVPDPNKDKNDKQDEKQEAHPDKPQPIRKEPQKPAPQNVDHKQNDDRGAQAVEPKDKDVKPSKAKVEVGSNTIDQAWIDAQDKEYARRKRLKLDGMDKKTSGPRPLDDVPLPQVGDSVRLTSFEVDGLHCTALNLANTTQQLEQFTWSLDGAHWFLWETRLKRLCRVSLKDFVLDRENADLKSTWFLSMSRSGLCASNAGVFNMFEPDSLKQLPAMPSPKGMGLGAYYLSAPGQDWGVFKLLKELHHHKIKSNKAGPPTTFAPDDSGQPRAVYHVQPVAPDIVLATTRTNFRGTHLHRLRVVENALKLEESMPLESVGAGIYFTMNVSSDGRYVAIAGRGGNMLYLLAMEDFQKPLATFGRPGWSWLAVDGSRRLIYASAAATPHILQALAFDGKVRHNFRFPFPIQGLAISPKNDALLLRSMQQLYHVRLADPPPVVVVEKVEPRETAQELYQRMQKTLSDRKVKKLNFDIDVQETEPLQLKGTLTLAHDNRMLLTFAGKDGGRKSNVTYISDGKSMLIRTDSGGKLLNKVTVPTPKNLHDLVHDALLHASLTTGINNISTAKPIRRDEMKVVGVKGAGTDKILGKDTVVIEYREVGLGTEHRCKLWLDPKTSLPVQRMIEVDRPLAGVLRAFELYTDWALDPQLPEATFKLPE
jgi:hypothetical protein